MWIYGLVGMVSTCWGVFARDSFKLFDKIREKAFKHGPDILWFGWYGEHVLGVNGVGKEISSL